jgi:putative ABC transport system ATP-binding protein
VAERALLEVRDLVKSYDDSPVLRGVCMTLDHGETVSLMGPSGTGKSTLLAILAGTMTPDSGEVRFGGQSVSTLDSDARTRLRREGIGVVLQSDNLIPFLTAAENVELALELAGANDPARRAGDLLAEFDLADRRGSYPRRLSGGEAQRVALAVALANQPRLLLADEVTAALDHTSADVVMDALIGAASDRGVGLLLITHSSSIADRADTRLVMAEGVVESQ